MKDLKIFNGNIYRLIILTFLIFTSLSPVQATNNSSSEVSKIVIQKVNVGYRTLTFTLNPATASGVFVKNYEIGFKGHYDKSEYGDPSSYCEVPAATQIKNQSTNISCVVDLNSIPIEVINQITAKGVVMDWVVRGNYQGQIGGWSDPFPIQLYKFPKFLYPTKDVASKTTQWPTGAIAKCKDGSYSFQSQHRGACSRHGGVVQWK